MLNIETLLHSSPIDLAWYWHWIHVQSFHWSVIIKSNIIAMLRIILNLHLIFAVAVVDDVKWRLCEYLSPSKYIGTYQFSTGTADIEPFESTTTSGKDICNEECDIKEDCYATSFSSKNNLCSFYNTSGFTVKKMNGLQYSRWLPCDMLKGYQPKDGRCLGLWVSYEGQFARVNEYEFLKNISNIRRIDCQKECLGNVLCGFVNTDDMDCMLVPKWPYLNWNSTKRSHWRMDKWTCVDNFVENLEVRRIEEQPNKDKCTGYWTIFSRHFIIKSREVTWHKFHTQIYKDCLEECNRYSNCFRVYYNVTYSLCILHKVGRSDGIPFHDYILSIVFDWICVKNDSHALEMNKVEKKYKNMGLNCHKIVSIKGLFIGMDRCGKMPPKSKFVECIETHDKYDWTITDSCSVNQSYWMFQYETVLLNETKGEELWNVRKIFTGLQLYWLAYLGNTSLIPVDYHECRPFNASRPIEILTPIEIITKDNWQALPQKGVGYKFVRRPVKLAITSSGEPVHSCRTKAACVDILRSLQVDYFNGDGETDHYVDIPFNFMIDEQGTIYEGRGWRNQCAAVATYNPETICFAYIGSFEDKPPGERFLDSLKKLIEFSVYHDFVERDYKLYIQQDLGQSSIHRNLEITMKNWYRYRGFVPEECRNTSVLNISLSFLTFSIASLVLLIFFYIVFMFKRSCENCKFLSGPKFQQHQFVPTSKQVTDDNTHSPKSKRNYIIYEKPTCMTDNQESDVGLIRNWFNGSTISFQDYLKNFPHIKTRVFIVEDDIESNDEGDPAGVNVIILVPHDNIMPLLNGLFENGSCICHYFTIQDIKKASLSISQNVAQSLV